MTDTGTGVLYIVATPIGNLEDISQRAARVLAQADLVAAEDTRHSKKLLQHLGISGKSLLSCHDHSQPGEINRLLQSLEQGQTIALVSDAGTPLISDPGFTLVDAARRRGIPVLPVPGASAITAALSVAGLATDRFAFEGFLPAKAGPRSSRLQELRLEQRSLVFFEAPHRIMDFLDAAISVFGGERRGFIARELTKKFEQHYCGNLEAIRDELARSNENRKGEFVIVMAGCSEEEHEQSGLERAVELVQLLRPNLSLKQAVAEACRFTGARKNSVYERALALDQESESGT